MRFIDSCIFLLSYITIGLFVSGSPVGESGAKKVLSKDLDLDKIYAPNPPVTHRVLMTIEYTDQATSKTDREEITIELYGTNTPKTVANFATLCVGMQFTYSNSDSDEVHKASFKESNFHRIIPNKLIQGGDVFERSMPLSIYGPNWADENFSLKHDRPGRVSMYNTGPNTQGSQFFITTDIEPATEFDMKNVVFGQVVSGLEWLIDKVQYIPTNSGDKPVSDVTIKYITVDELTLADKIALQADYSAKLDSFNRGEMSDGITLKSIFNKGKIEEKEMEDIQLNQLGHPLQHVLIGLVALAAIYLLAKYRRFVLPKSSKIVSMRHE